jgi:hypothetical protein
MSQRTCWILTLLVVLFALLAGESCHVERGHTGGPPTQDGVGSSGCQPDGGKLQLGCAAFPDTTPKSQPDWDYFAWNTFVAANWPAVDPAANNEQRGFPSLPQKDEKPSFVQAANDSLLVWETFKEKREVFFYPPGNTRSPGPWNQAPEYGPVNEKIPLCSDFPAALRATAYRPRRFFGDGSEIHFFNSLDETVEVASEALEPTDQLCRGNPNPQCGTPNKRDCCYVHKLGVGPRVWKGTPLPNHVQPVIYEVKVNWDYYNYVVANQFYLDSTAAAEALKGTIRLPYRTSAQHGFPYGHQAVAGYSAQRCIQDFDSKVNSNSHLTPCPAGSIQIKAAWIQLHDPQDFSRYHTADAAYFKTENGKTCMSHGTFGLIGLHIIQRIHQEVAGQPMPLGGTFVFATWEHVDNEKAGFTYADYLPHQPHYGPPKEGFYPPPHKSLPVERKFPILANTREINDKVHAAISKLNRSSVWLNYELVGVQFQPVNIGTPPAAEHAFPIGPNDPTGIGQPLYLANLVIETNDGLQHFQGLPPLVEPVRRFANVVKANHALGFERSMSNLSFGQKQKPTAFNMGGCMGCHGVAEVKGYSFSFVLLGGQRGADVDTQKSFDVPPPPTEGSE